MDDHQNHLPPLHEERHCYYLSNQVIHGPIPLSQFHEFASKQLIAPDDLVWFDRQEGRGFRSRT